MLGIIIDKAKARDILVTEKNFEKDEKKKSTLLLIILFNCLQLSIIRFLQLMLKYLLLGIQQQT